MSNNKFNFSEENKQAMEQARKREIRMEILFSLNSKKPNPRMGELIAKYIEGENPESILEKLKDVGIKEIIHRGFYYDHKDTEAFSWIKTIIDSMLRSEEPLTPELILEFKDVIGLDIYLGKLVRLRALTETYDHKYEDQVKFIKMLVDKLVSTTDNETLDQNLITLLGIKDLLVINKDHDVFVYLLESCLSKDDHCLTQSLIELLGIKELLYKSYVAYAYNGHGDENFIYLLDLVIPKTQKYLDLELIKALGLKDFITRSAEPKSYGKTELYARDQFLYLLEKCLPQPTTELNLQVIQLLGLRSVIAQVPGYQKAKIVAVILKQLKNDTQTPKIMAELGITPEDIKQFVRAAVENDMDDVLKEIIAGPFNTQLIDELDLDACVVVGARHGRLKVLEFIIGKYLTDETLSPELIERLKIREAIIAAGVGGQPSTLIYLLKQ